MFQKRSDEVEEGEHKYPYQVNKMPVKAGFLDHFIVATLIIGAGIHVQENDHIDHHSAEYVKTMETCHDKEQGRKSCRPKRIAVQRSTFGNELCPLPCLAAQKGEPAQDG